jgi:hypothetical protein
MSSLETYHINSFDGDTKTLVILDDKHEDMMLEEVYQQVYSVCDELEIPVYLNGYEKEVELGSSYNVRQRISIEVYDPVSESFYDDLRKILDDEWDVQDEGDIFEGDNEFGAELIFSRDVPKQGDANFSHAVQV